MMPAWAHRVRAVGVVVLVIALVLVGVSLIVVPAWVIGLPALIASFFAIRFGLMMLEFFELRRASAERFDRVFRRLHRREPPMRDEPFSVSAWEYFSQAGFMLLLSLVLAGGLGGVLGWFETASVLGTSMAVGGSLAGAVATHALVHVAALAYVARQLPRNA